MHEASVLLASDLDGTLIPSEPGPEHLGAVNRFSEEIARRRKLLVAYVTGRHRALADDAIRQFELPAPDFLVCDVGTSIYRRTGGGFVKDEDYAQQMRQASGGADAHEARRLLSEIEGLVAQPTEKQAEYKASFDFPSARLDEVLGEVRERLGDRPVNVVVSVDPYNASGLMDILPAGIGKDTAIRHLLDYMELDEECLYYAGDSGNDLEAMLSGWRVVVVGNAPDDLKAHLTREAETRGILDRLYFAEARYAAGVLEGCRHWGLLE